MSCRSRRAARRALGLAAVLAVTAAVMAGLLLVFWASYEVGRAVLG